jgi:SAM-dependent methyltransferase
MSLPPSGFSSARPAATDADYALGRTGAEHTRLMDQAALLRPSTARLLGAAGVTAGMRVLDVGCGVGDVSFLAAEFVGPAGQVVGVDLDATALTLAEERRANLRLAQVRFLQGDARDAEIGTEFDAVIGRLVLMYHADPTESLRRLARRLRPGGIVALQEIASGVTSWQIPQLPLATNVLHWIKGAFVASGAHVNLGWELYWRMLDAGLEPHPAPLVELPLEAGPDSAAYARLATLVRSLRPTIVRIGLATEDETDPTTLPQRLRAEALAARTTVPIFSGLFVGQWGRKRAHE